MSVEERGQAEELLQGASSAELPPTESTETDAPAADSSVAAESSAAPEVVAEAESAAAPEAEPESPPEVAAEAEAEAGADAMPSPPLLKKRSRIKPRSPRKKPNTSAARCIRVLSAVRRRRLLQSIWAMAIRASCRDENWN